TELLDEGVPEHRIEVVRRVHLRYDGTDTALQVGLGDLETMVAEFEEAYRRTYAFLMDRPLVAEAVSVEAVGRTEQPDASLWDSAAAGPVRERAARPVDTVAMWVEGAWRDVPLFRRELLSPGATVTGPALITEEN